MKSIETSIRIEAEPAAVWRQLMDFQSHADWNPFLVSIEGKPEVGSFLKNTIQTSEKKQMQFEPEVLVVDEYKEFRWKGKLFVKGLFDGEHYFKLTALPDGATLLTHGELFTGLLAGALYSMIGKDTTAGFEAMNEALKAKVESKGKESRHAG